MREDNKEKGVIDKLNKLSKKFKDDEQEMDTHIEGMIHAKYLNYWDYLELDTLLSLQRTKTVFPDEEVFLTYHQITELYFKLIIKELKKAVKNNTTSELFLECISRVNRYVKVLLDSFPILTEGMEKKQFERFRMSLYPASGFQSYQFRVIELFSTDILNLIDKDLRATFGDQMDIEQMFDNIYWKKGAVDLKTGKKTLSLTEFEAKYDKKLINKADKMREKSLLKRFFKVHAESEFSDQIINELKQFDINMNVSWKLLHFKAAAKHLLSKGAYASSTGCTNWEKYLPPRFQRIIFFPELWTENELKDWGKSWVMKEVFAGNDMPYEYTIGLPTDGDYY